MLDSVNTLLGFQSEGNGRELLFVHSGIADSRMWDAQWTAFLPLYRLIRADLRGFGKSPPRIVDGADHHDLLSLVDHLGIERAAVIGSSFGGNVAVDFAVTYPTRVSALVLVGTLAGMTEPTAPLRQLWAETDAALASGEIERGVELELRAWVDGPYRTPEEVGPAVRDAVRDMNRQVWTRAAVEGPPGTSEPPIDRVARLSEIAVSTLLIEGTVDQPDVAASMDRLAGSIPHAERARIPGAAHFPNRERPAEFNAAVLEFLERVFAP